MQACSTRDPVGDVAVGTSRPSTYMEHDALSHCSRQTSYGNALYLIPPQGKKHMATSIVLFAVVLQDLGYYNALL